MLDDVGVVRDHARDELLAVRQLHLLPHPPLVLVPRVGLFHRVGTGADLQDQVDDVAELSPCRQALKNTAAETARPTHLQDEVEVNNPPDEPHGNRRDEYRRFSTAGHT
ncbi:hypothetical protein REH65_18625 [Saccharopolyspora sp. ID03-671]|uniref:hypothetical protein n=1 Tax=Saccharopolyspora sp. ID03-671 TaxID=3073066 RepID=UPI00324EE37B